MLITVLIVVLLSGLMSADVVIKCNNSSDSRLNVLPANDGVDGRYKVEWCTLPKSTKTVSSWDLTLRYNENRPAEKCHGDSILYGGQVHSFFDKDVDISHLNCSNVCFITNLDLIFNGSCYLVKTFLHHSRMSESPADHLFYVTNAFPKERFTRSETRVEIHSFNQEHLSAKWYLSYIPASEYTMSLCSVLKTTKEEYCEVVNQNCSTVGARQTEVQCSLRAPYGYYNMRLQHSAPWDASLLFRRVTNANHEFEHLIKEITVSGSSNSALWFSSGALLLALVVALAVLLTALIRRRRDNCPSQDGNTALAAHAHAARATAEDAPARRARDRVLLVYARDCAHVMRVAALLRKLLNRVTDDKVYDLFAMDTWREAAGAAGEWVRRAMWREDVRIVLLQTPAAQLCAPATAADLKLEQPLLGRRVVYRAPLAADTLVSLALRLLSETAHARHAHAYRKCYKATISGLKVDLAPTVTPLRWYDLPKDILLLLRDLDPDLFPSDSPTSPLPLDPEFKQDLDEFYQAIDDLLEYVRDNPGYLNDEVLYI